MADAARQQDIGAAEEQSQAPVAVLRDLAQRAPESVVLAAIDALEVAVDEQAKGPFVARALHALAHIAEHATNRSLLGAAGAASDSLVLLQALNTPESLAELKDEDPLIEARIRGTLAQRKLLHEEGGVCSAEEFGKILGHLSRQAIDMRRKKRKLIALDLGRHGYRYPVWQIHNGAVLPGLEQVLAELREADPWTQVGFMLSPNSWLGGKTPLNELRRGEIDRVVATAGMFAE
jgi:hypothetical protein